MGGCHKIDVMTADLLEVKHHICQVFILDLLPSPLMRDGPVLAEDTAKVTVREEDGPRPFPAHQRHLLSKMRVIAKNHGLDRSSAEPLLSLLPIYTTLPGTELATFKERIGLLDSLS